MESKEIRDLMEAYYSIYEAKEDPEMEEGEEDEEEEYKGKKKGKKEKEEKMKEEVEIDEDAGIVSGLVGLALGAKGAYHAAKKTKRMRDYPKNFVKGIADPRTYVPQKKKEQKEEFDIFDVILEHLVAEGYADTNQAALAIMANMSEEWRQDIVEGMTMDDFKKQRRRQKEEPPIRKRGGLSAPEDERSIGGEANRRNKDYWASVVGKNRDRGAGNKAKRRSAEMG